MCDGDCDYCDLEDCEEGEDWLSEECKYCERNDCDNCWINDQLLERELEKGVGKDPIIFS
jgi:hypothetical protein